MYVLFFQKKLRWSSTAGDLTTTRRWLLLFVLYRRGLASCSHGLSVLKVLQRDLRAHLTRLETPLTTGTTFSISQSSRRP